jgi:UPF0755 protein
VLFRHLRERSPYNTYLHAGLPPTPIANPGRSSIEATLDPEIHDWLFFVATPDGRVMYSRTAGQHADSANLARSEWAVWRDSIARAERERARPRSPASPTP